MSSQLKSKIIQVKKEKRNYSDEYNKKLDFINNSIVFLEITSDNVQSRNELLSKIYIDLNDLLSNEYFQISYINNPVSSI